MNMRKNMHAYPEFGTQAGLSLFLTFEIFTGHSLR